MYEFSYHKLQHYHQNNSKLQYVDTESFVLSFKTTDLTKNSECFTDDFDFCELAESLQ